LLNIDSKKIRFHLDEHVDPGIALALRRYGIGITTTNEAGLRTLDDSIQIEFMRQERRVIVTRDKDFLRFASRSSDHPGIVFLSYQLTVGEIIDGLILIYEVLSPEEIAGRVEFL